MKHLFIILLLALACIPAASAYGYSYNAPSGYCVWTINFDIPDDSTGIIVMTQANGQTVTATWERGGLPMSHVSSTIGSDSGSFDLFPVVPLYGSIWNGENTTKARQLKMGTGLVQGGWSRVIQTTIDPAVITSYQISSTKPITATQDLMVTTSAVKALGSTDSDTDLVALLKALIPMAVTGFMSLLWWLKFLFIDNLILVVALYLTGSMAYSILTSRSIFKFYERWFKQQKALFEFISNGFNTTLQIITQIAAIVTTPIGAATTIIGAAILWLSTMW
jgi:hypothetical protein